MVKADWQGRYHVAGTVWWSRHNMLGLSGERDDKSCEGDTER